MKLNLAACLLISILTCLPLMEKYLLNFFASYKMVPLIGKTTRITSNSVILIDNICTNNLSYKLLLSSVIVFIN